MQEKYTSRYDDMKLAMFLLGNAFRLDSGKPPEKVLQVKPHTPRVTTSRATTGEAA